MLLSELCSNPGAISAIFQHHNNIVKSRNVELLVNTIVNNFYDNIACGSMWKQPIIRLISDMIAFEVNR